MKIKERLSLQFTLTFAILLLLVLVSVYALTESNREANFYNRLKERAFTTAQIFLAQDNLTSDKFKEVQKRFPHTLPEEELKIYNEQGVSVYINQASPNSFAEKINDVIKNKEVRFQQNGKQVVGIYYPDNSGNFIVFAAAMDIYEFKHMHQLLMIMTILFLFSIIIVFFLGRWFARTALNPINKIIGEVKFIRSNLLDKRLDKGNNKDEISELSNTINNLLEHLEQSFSAQRSFITHASHELRTPLTSVIGQVEVTLQKERATEEYKKVLEIILYETGKINELINSLFELVNANMDSDDFHEIRLDELLWQVKDEYENKFPESSIELSLPETYNERAFTISGNWHLLFIAIGNIVKNGLKFSSFKPIFCRMKIMEEYILITIADKGIGIQEEDMANIFQPFFRGSNVSGLAGMGVGLSLSEKNFKIA